MKCSSCGKEAKTPGRKQCDKCRIYRMNWSRRRAEERVASGLCCYGKCPNKQAAGIMVCEKHREIQRQKNAARKKKGKRAGKVSIINKLQDFDSVL